MPKTIKLPVDKLPGDELRIDKLPVEILWCILMILSLVNPRTLVECIPQVCRPLSEAYYSMGPVLLDLRCMLNAPPEVINKFPLRTYELNLSGCRNVTYAVLKLIAAGCPRLATLKLSYC